MVVVVLSSTHPQEEGTSSTMETSNIVDNKTATTASRKLNIDCEWYSYFGTVSLCSLVPSLPQYSRSSMQQGRLMDCEQMTILDTMLIVYEE